MGGLSSRFASAIHVAAMMAAKPDEPVTSAVVAESVNTNPVVIRRLMASLKAAGIVVSQPGVSGGFLLARRPEAVTLGQLFRAVEGNEGNLFRVHRKPNEDCPVGEAIGRLMCQLSREAECALLSSLDRWSVADVARSIKTGAV